MSSPICYQWAIQEKSKQGDWRHEISTGIEEIASGIKGVN